MIQFYYNNNKNYSVWTPRIIDDYYPPGTLSVKEKINLTYYQFTLRHKSVTEPKDRPESYLPISLIIENGKQMRLLKPVENKGYSSLVLIYHKSLRGVSPSIHKHIKGVLIINIFQANTVDDKIISENTSPGFQIWFIWSSSIYL